MNLLHFRLGWIPLDAYYSPTPGRISVGYLGRGPSIMQNTFSIFFWLSFFFLSLFFRPYRWLAQTWSLCQIMLEYDIKLLTKSQPDRKWRAGKGGGRYCWPNVKLIDFAGIQSTGHPSPPTRCLFCTENVEVFSTRPRFSLHFFFFVVFLLLA